MNGSRRSRHPGYTRGGGHELSHQSTEGKYEWELELPSWGLRALLLPYCLFCCYYYYFYYYYYYYYYNYYYYCLRNC